MRALSRIALLSTLVAVSATPSFAQSLTAGPEILVTTAGYLHVREAAPAIALRSDGGFVSVWRDSRSIHTRAFAASDAPLSAARKLSSAGPDSPRLAALASGGFVAVWTGYRPPTPPTYTGDGTIVVQLLDSAGNRLGSPQELDNGSGVAEGVGDPAVAAEPPGAGQAGPAQTPWYGWFLEALAFLGVDNGCRPDPFGGCGGAASQVDNGCLPDPNGGCGK